MFLIPMFLQGGPKLVGDPNNGGGDLSNILDGQTFLAFQGDVRSVASETFFKSFTILRKRQKVSF